MHITLIGAILIPLGIYAYFFAPNLLYVGTIFLLPFSATAIINFGFMDATKSIQAIFYFGTLWMLSAGPGALKRSGYGDRDRCRHPCGGCASLCWSFGCPC